MPRLFFDLELFLTAHCGSFAWTELPVELSLQTEKSTVRVLKEFILAAYWVTRIRIRLSLGRYGTSRAAHRLIQKYRFTPFSTRCFLALRALLTPYATLAEKIPLQGKILDLGCGHGLFSLKLALHSPEREILAVDHDDRRLTIARKASHQMPQLQWKSASALEFESPTLFDAIAAIDMLHYFDLSEQEVLLSKLRDLLTPQGVFIFREVNPQGGWASKWNQLYEKLAVRLRFTQASHERMQIKTPKQWIEQLERLGFEATSQKCSSMFFSDELFVCRKKSSFA